MRRFRPAHLVRNDLENALAYQRAYKDRPALDWCSQLMRDDNEREISNLRSELAEALAGDLELSLDGFPVEDHRISLPYFNRVTESLQAAYRAVYRALSADGRLRRGEANLSIAGTGPGSFRVSLKAPPAQLVLLDEPMIDRAMAVIIDLLQAAAGGTALNRASDWAAIATEPEVRAMIRVSSALASSQGTTRLRWRGTQGVETTVELRPAAAVALAVALSGTTGREIITVTGHLEMAQEQPPRVRVRTADDEHLASVTPEMLDRVKALLFDDVRATLVIEMRTSPTSGSPDTRIELMDLEPA